VHNSNLNQILSGVVDDARTSAGLMLLTDSEQAMRFQVTGWKRRQMW
jgi:hypothetical protein